MTGVLVRERLHETHRCRRDLEQRRHEKMDAEIGENYKPRTPRIVSCHPHPGERHGRNSLSEPPGESNPADTLISRLLASWTMRE